jgi:hypothetical protein
MTIPCHRALFVFLLAASALLLASVPHSASAHDHPSPGTSSEAPVNAHEWSQSCPTAPGQPCCCAGVFALSSAGKPAPVAASGWSRPVALLAGAAKFANLEVPRVATPSWYQARPRAPPLPS